MHSIVKVLRRDLSVWGEIEQKSHLEGLWDFSRHRRVVWEIWQRKAILSLKGLESMGKLRSTSWRMEEYKARAISGETMTASLEGLHLVLPEMGSYRRF